MALEAALRQWGSAVEIGERLSEGTRNRSWSVRINGERAVARRSRRSADWLDWEIRLLAYLRKHRIGVPSIIPTVAREAFVDGWTMCRFVDGRAPGTVEDWRGVREVLRTVHALTSKWEQRPGAVSTADLLRANRGGDVDLGVMPTEAVGRCRWAWAAIAGEPVSVVHGDPNAHNIRITETGEVVLLDWDEARVDASILDFADLPGEALSIQEELLARARQAAHAWEAACSWRLEPEYALRRLRKLR